MRQEWSTGKRGGGSRKRPKSSAPSPLLPVLLPFFLSSLLIGSAFAQTVQPVPEVNWIPRQGVELQALNKVTARSTVLDAKVGQTLQFGTLAITVTACVVRPPDQPADAAAFVQITDSDKGEPGFRGWMLKDEPAVSMFQNPLYDVRLNGCRA